MWVNSCAKTSSSQSSVLPMSSEPDGAAAPMAMVLYGIGVAQPLASSD